MKPIKGYENLYSVTPDGQVFSHRAGRFMKLQLGRGTTVYYYHVILSNKGKIQNIFVHKLVAQTFIPNPENLTMVDHINRNALDNRVENLRWCTFQDNQRNRGRRTKGSSQYKGVYKSGDLWIASVGLNKKRIYVGRYKLEIDAAKAYNEYVKKNYGSFAVINEIPVLSCRG